MATTRKKEEVKEKTEALALDSEKQKEFEEKVGKIKPKVINFILENKTSIQGVKFVRYEFDMILLQILMKLLFWVHFSQAKGEELTPGVIYLGHIPHGFYESEMRNFFQQFGTVNRVRLSRSKKVSKFSFTAHRLLLDL